MKVLIVGSGGREHALAWKLGQSPKLEKIYIAPGNAGTALVGKNIPAKTTDEIVLWLKDNPMDLVVVGPDNYLAEGIVDEVQKLRITVFGPTKAAAEIEWSKSYAKQFMREERIPTAQYRVFTTAELARSYIRTQKLPLVIKADGLAFGKGVVIARTIEEADKAILDMLEKKIFGESGSLVIIEEYLEGFEVSVHAFCDGENAAMFPASKDHKRIFDGDRGSNTGGMGTVAPVSSVPARQLEIIREQIIMPTLASLKARGRPFKGILFPGIMLTRYGPKVIEFNARFGDPETQSYMRLLETDLPDILLACANGSLSTLDIKWSDKYASCIVLASAGYPGEYEKGIEITGLPAESDVVVFHAGTKLEGDKYLTNGGRVLGVTTTGKTLEESLENSYDAIKAIKFDGMQFRSDIGAVTLEDLSSI